VNLLLSKQYIDSITHGAMIKMNVMSHLYVLNLSSDNDFYIE